MTLLLSQGGPSKITTRSASIQDKHCNCCCVHYEMASLETEKIYFGQVRKTKICMITTCFEKACHGRSYLRQDQHSNPRTSNRSKLSPISRNYLAKKKNLPMS